MIAARRRAHESAGLGPAYRRVGDRAVCVALVVLCGCGSTARRRPARPARRPRCSRRRVRSGEGPLSAAGDGSGARRHAGTAGPTGRRPRRAVRRQPRGVDPGRDRHATAAQRLSADGSRAPAATGELVTLEPTGVVLVRRGATLDAGRPVPLMGAAAVDATDWPRSRHSRQDVRVFVNGRPWQRPAGAVPLRRHAEIVLEVGPYVPPHASYTFPPGDSSAAERYRLRAADVQRCRCVTSAAP